MVGHPFHFSSDEMSGVNASLLCATVVCTALSDGAAAVFGPMSSTAGAHLRSLCAAVQLPHFEVAARSDQEDEPDASHNFTVNLFPHHAALSRALVDFVRHLQWTSVTLLYVNDDGITLHS